MNNSIINKKLYTRIIDFSKAFDTIWRKGLIAELNCFGIERKMLNTQVQHVLGPLINTQKSVCLSLWDNYEVYGHKILHIESFSVIESENLVRISKFFI